MFHTYVLVHAQDPIKGGKKMVDIDRASFLAEIVDGKQKIVEILPKLNK
jgi:hypothetical protein